MSPITLRTRPQATPRLRFQPGHTPTFVLPAEVQYQLSMAAQALQEHYPNQSLDQVQRALETWLVQSIHYLAENAVWHCHSGHDSFAVNRTGFKQALHTISPSIAANDLGDD